MKKSVTNIHINKLNFILFLINLKRKYRINICKYFTHEKVFLLHLRISYYPNNLYLCIGI